MNWATSPEATSDLYGKPQFSITSFDSGLVVLSPQPTSNLNQQLNQKQLFLPKLFIDDVAGQCSLLLLI